MVLRDVKAAIAKARKKYPRPTVAEPLSRDIMGWLESSSETALSTDGCYVQLQGVCEHGHCSWLIMLGLIEDVKQEVKRMPRTFILDTKGQPIEEKDDAAWSRWMKENFYSTCLVAREQVGAQLVSTAFLGMDHRYPSDGDGPPLLFETAVMNAAWEESFMARTSSREEALAMQQETVRRLKGRRDIILDKENAV